jgi:hypothetical protein
MAAPEPSKTGQGFGRRCTHTVGGVPEPGTVVLNVVFLSSASREMAVWRHTKFKDVVGSTPKISCIFR